MNKVSEKINTISTEHIKEVRELTLWKLLSGDFVLLVIISCLIASPIAWYFLNGWLKKYVYHTEITWWIFVMAGICALTITILTVSYQAIKAALANPVSSLRSE